MAKKKMSKKKKVVLGVVCVLVVAVCGAVGMSVLGGGTKDVSGAPKGAIPAKIETAHKETIVTKVNAKGMVELLKTYTVYPETEARIVSVLVAVGDKVSVGDVLVRYDPDSVKKLKDQLADAQLSLKAAQLAMNAAQLPPSETEITSSDSQVNQAQKMVTDSEAAIADIDISLGQLEINLADKQKTYTDKQFLLKSGVISQTEMTLVEDELTTLKNKIETTKNQRQTAVSALETSKNNLAFVETQKQATINKQEDPASKNQVSQQQVRVAQAALTVQQLQKDISDFKVDEISEVSGTVLSVAATEGYIADRLRVLLEVGDVTNDNMVVRVNVPESRTSELALGQKVEIKGEALGTAVYTGEVVKIAPQALKKEVGKSLETVVVVDVKPTDAGDKIKPGFTLETNIVTGTKVDAVVVPMMALMKDMDDVESQKDYVFVMKPDFSLEKRIVEIGAYSGLFVEALGVNDGESVVVNPDATLAEGAFVRPLPDESAAPMGATSAAKAGGQ